ncbi:MAG: aldo/keto reductase, partial [Armatimonadetes bacterium]|nr:aldo/keto reductase [Armatimonadota bacterium]
MEYRTLGRTGLRVSAVSLGAWEIGGAVRLSFEKLGTISHGWGKTDDAESVALIDRCRHAGVNLIDTAPAYGAGHSEEVIGRALQGCREHWVVCTKGGHGATDGVAWNDFSKARLLGQIDESLARLRMSCVDVYLLHGPSAEDVRRGECLEAMESIRQQGKARFVGVSIGSNEMGVELIRRGVVDV